MNGASLLSKVSQVLKKVKACDKDVYLKLTVGTGGNSAIHSPSVITLSNTLVTPRPAMSLVNLEEAQGSNGVLMLGDVIFIFSGSIAQATLEKSSILYGTTNYRIIKLLPIVYDQTIVSYEVYCRRAGV